MIEKDIYAALIDHAGLYALISMRVYPLVLPESCTKPAVVMQRISPGGDFNTLDGVSDTERPRFQFSCYAHDYSDAKDVAFQLKAALKESALKVSCYGDVDMFDNDQKLYRITVDFHIWATVDYT